MTDLHIGDLLLLNVDRSVGCSIAHLARRQQAVLADLHKLLPRLALLRFGELDARVVPDTQGYRLRLQLRLRQRSLLVDPRQYPRALEEEVELLRDDIRKVGLCVLRRAREVKQRGSRAPCPKRDSMLELLARRARQQWRFEVEHQQIELPFPDCPRYFEDVVLHRVDGIVHAITEHTVVIRCAEIWTTDPTPKRAALIRKLCVQIPNPFMAEKKREISSSDRIQCGQPSLQWVRLKRCILTAAVIGAVKVSSEAEAEPAAARPDAVRHAGGRRRYAAVRADAGRRGSGSHRKW